MSSVSQSNKDETTLIKALDSIHSSNGNALTNAFVLYDVCALFTKYFAAAHINKYRCNALINGLIEALDHIGTLPVDSVTGLITAAFILGQSCWVSCVSLLPLVNTIHRDDAIAKFSVYLNL